MSTPIYMDNAATTPIDPRVAARMMQCLTREGDFGNPSSASHVFGERARRRVEAAREQVAASIGCSPQEIVWTSGATEANNLAIFGVADYYRGQGRHIVTARSEHKAVLDPCRELEKRGWQVTYLTPDRRGIIAAHSVAESLREDTVLVSIMHVNNEIGVIQDVAAIAAVCRERGKPLHVDAAQSLGKCRLDVAAMGIALASVSAHKAYGPKGAGALVLNDASGLYLQPRQYGGGQERGLRPGTLATHQLAGMGEAFEIAEAEREAESRRIAPLRARLWERLQRCGGLENGDSSNCVPHILNVSFAGVEGESLLAALGARVAVSAGSACMSAVQEPSYVLRALGRSEALAQSSLRFGLGRFTTEEDIENAGAAVCDAVERLRRIAGAPGPVDA